MRGRRRPRAAAARANLFACATLLLALPSAAPAGAIPGPDLGWHVIRPGDTLEGLAIKFLGGADRWPELHRLNPRILDPHWIYPGRRVLVPVARPSTAPNAQVTTFSNRVEARPAPVEWLPADRGDLLLERDSLRTYKGASARLLFDDGTLATVSEDSLVFIRRQSSARALSPVKEIEIELGQAEFEARSRGGSVPEIEIFVGGTRSSGRPAESGILKSRHRLAGDAAQVMLYEGAARVTGEAGALDLPPGTGTTVRPDAPPTPAEPLLPAPALVSPPDDLEIGVAGSRIVLRWKAVEGAASYLVELCADRACGALVERVTGVTATEFRPRLQVRELVRWRVTAVSRSGLDGFPSESRVIRPRLLVLGE